MVLILLLIGLSLTNSDIPIAYRKGLEAYEVNRFEEAKLNFRSFLLSHKEHSLYPDGLYYYARLEKDGEESKKIFLYLLANYPDNRRAPHAYFMVAKYYHAKENPDKADTWFKKLISSYPESDVAVSANNWFRRVFHGKECAKWAVQVGAFGSRENAKQAAEKLRKSDYPAVLIKRKGPKTTLWLVRVGYFHNRNEALATQKKLEETGYKTYLVKKQCKN